MDDDTVRVELPEPPELRTTDEGLTDAVSPDGDVVVDNVTIPVNPLRLPSWTVDAPEDPLRMVREAGLDETVKSTTLTVTTTECESDPIVPVTVTVYVPTVAELTVSVDVADPPGDKLTLVGLTPAVRPDGETVVERLIVPVNPARLVKVIVDVPEPPA